MVTTYLSTLALPLVLSVLPIQALTTLHQNDHPEFRSLRFEARPRSRSASPLVRNLNGIVGTLVNMTNESDMEVKSHSVHKSY